MASQLEDLIKKMTSDERKALENYAQSILEKRQKIVQAASEEQRPFGLCAGEFTAPEDFNAPLPESVLREFENA